MKKKVQNPLKVVSLLAAFLMVGNVAFGTTYTAVASGNWSSVATWGGSAPPFNITGSDQVNIAAGITVTMDQNVTVNNPLASITVGGTLSGDPYIKLNVLSGTIAGSGSINAANVMLNAGSFFSFSGSLIADTLTNAIVSLSNSSQITVNNALMLPAAVDIMVGGSLTMGNNSNINITGGNLAVVGGNLNLTANYNVSYMTGSLNAGAELSGSGLRKVMINIGAGNTLSLSSNITTNDSLNFISGALALNNYNLTINGALTGNVMIQGASASDLTINTPGGITAAIAFPAGFQTIGSLTVNVGAGNSILIGSNLNIQNSLTLSKGNMLNINGYALTLNGNLDGNGSFIANSGSQLNFNGNISITSPVMLTGSDLGKFTLNIGKGNMATLGTGLTVDTLSLQSGTLVLNSNNVNIMAGIAAGGTGVIASDGAAGISVASSASLMGGLSFDATQDTVKSLTVNIGGGGSLNLGSDLVINGALNFKAGYVNVQSNNLMIGVAGSINGANPNAYVITGPGGYLTMFATVSNHTMFQVGTQSDYLPASISLNPGSAVGTIGVNVSAGVYSNGITGVEISNYEPMVNATWLFQNNIGTGLNANMQLSWQASAEVNGFVHTGDYISHYTTGAWDDIIGDTMTAVLNGSLYTATRANVTSMSPFAVFDQSTVPTGIASVSSTAGGFEIYPNPTNNNLYINNPALTKGSTVYVEVYNTLGQVVAKTQYNNQVLILPVSTLPPGDYLLRLYNDNMSVVKKFIKE